MGIIDFFKKINMAGGRDPTQAIFAGLEGLGLRVSRQQGAVTALAGSYQGREAAMLVDGSRIMQAGNRAMLGAAAVGMVGAFGALSPTRQDWLEHWGDFRARQQMQSAQMLLRWAVFLAYPASGTLQVGRHSAVGPAIAPGLYGGADGGAAQVLAHPAVHQALAGTRFDEILCRGDSIQAFWAPPMKEYQKVAASPQAFTATSHAALETLSMLAAGVEQPG